MCKRIEEVVVRFGYGGCILDLIPRAPGVLTGLIEHELTEEISSKMGVGIPRQRPASLVDTLSVK